MAIRKSLSRWSELTDEEKDAIRRWLPLREALRREAMPIQAQAWDEFWRAIEST
jgi:hypothetical protein